MIHGRRQWDGGVAGLAALTVALGPEELDLRLPRVVAETSGGYDHGAWFHGTSDSIPRRTGYAVGFEFVRRYLEANPGSRASGLVAQPDVSFLE